MTKNTNEIISTQFHRDDWVRIRTALMSYVIAEENRLVSQNVGDRPWTDLEYYNGLISDIDLYVLPED